MTKKRKTIEVEKLKETANKLLALETISEGQKQGICDLIEIALHDTGNYHGFNYVYWLDKGCDAWIKAGYPEGPEKNQFIGPEYSRRYY